MKRVEIDKLLRWAYRDELPKAQPAGDVWGREATSLGVARGWDAVSEFGKLLAVVDVNAYGVVPNRHAGDDPHPDAIIIAGAVASLDELELDFPNDWAPLADLGDLGSAGWKATADALDKVSVIGRDGRRALRQSPRLLVQKHAILGGAPDWECEQPSIEFVRPAHGGSPLWFITRREAIGEDLQGQPVYGDVERDGYDAKRKRPVADAYRKTLLDPDPMWAAVSRAEYEIWHAALGLLASELEGDLYDAEPLPLAMPARPWESPPEAKGRVLPDLTPPKVAKPVLRLRKRAQRVVATVP